MHAEPGPEHVWLHQLLGDWSVETECPGGPGQPAAALISTEHVRSVGGLWIVAETQGEMPGGGPSTTIMTLGFDAARGRFVGNVIASMMTHLWPYDGTLDATGKALTLDSQGPDFAAPGRIARYRDVITMLGPDRRGMTSDVETADGGWRPIMRATHARR